MSNITVNENDRAVTVKLENVRLSFPHLFEPHSFDGDKAKGKYQATFLLPKESDGAELMKRGVKEVIRMAFKGKSPGAERVCLKDGATKDFDGYDDSIVFVPANSVKAVPVVDRDLTPLSATDGKPYAGCYVNASIRLWAQDNKYGKRVNAQLRAVQFCGDGEPFGAGGANVAEEFSDISSGSSASTDEDWL